MEANQKYYFFCLDCEKVNTTDDIISKTRYPLTIDIAEHLRITNHQNIVPINERSYVKLNKCDVSHPCTVINDEDHDDRSKGQKEVKNKFSCDQCGKQFTLKNNLHQHIQ